MGKAGRSGRSQAPPERPYLISVTFLREKVPGFEVYPFSIPAVS